MKIYISADFEGVNGIVDRSQCFPGHPEFDHARRLWIDEINAVVEGVIAAGADQVVVNEAHAGMNYLLPERLHPKASFISGYVKLDNQMEGIDPTFDGAVLMGHAKPGSADAVLNHAYVMRDVVEIRLNGESIGELGLNALWAGYFRVPVILVVGDDKFAEEARTLIPGVETAVVKTGLSQFSAHCLPIEAGHRLIQEAAAQAIQRLQSMHPVPLPPEFRMEIDFSLSEVAKLCAFVPGVELIGPRSIAFSAKDYRALQHMRIVCTNLLLGILHAHF